ncbi:nuclear transcription factor Y subunit beta-like [Coccinella septempunctata]|uniref:nuclear transcription factor Y subunit beta-like n=1 Tax=Coccinella septempunctata TaxID=41139 RepID=UPI001D08FA00|nr:nuclear transcription factor Y subunit beta-like [Coccinella septempunctata]
MITLTLLTISLHAALSEVPPYSSKPFRPSQPYPLIDRIQSPIPAKQYGPPKPVYGVPSRPDDTIEPTTPANNFKGAPSKFNSQNFQLGQIQSLPQKDHRGTTIIFPSQQMSAQQFNQLSQQQLPGFNKQLFRPQQKLQMFTSTNSLQGQLLPNPVQTHTFNKNKVAAQFIQVPQNFQQLPFRNFNFEIQKSQEFQLRDAAPTRSPPSNVNFNNQNTINVQTPSLFNINTNTSPKQKTGRNNQKLQRNPDSRISDENMQIEFLDKNKFSNDGILAAKRASSSRRGGRVTAAPSRQYLSPVPTTSEPVAPPTIRRRPPTTQATETENNPVARGPNVSISNSFAGRLFLLRPDGRLEPVILKRANPNESDMVDRNNITPAELIQPLFNPLSIPK